MKDQQKAEEIAGNRVQLILPLLEASLDPALAREKESVFVKRTQSLKGH